MELVAWAWGSPLGPALVPPASWVQMVDLEEGDEDAGCAQRMNTSLWWWSSVLRARLMGEALGT